MSNLVNINETLRGMLPALEGTVQGDVLSFVLRIFEEQATAPSLLAPDYKGMRCNGLRYLREDDADGDYAYMRGEMANHLEELATRYYSGDITAVDEFLQLYSIGQEQRKALQEGTSSAKVAQRENRADTPSAHPVNWRTIGADLSNLPGYLLDVKLLRSGSDVVEDGWRNMIGVSGAWSIWSGSDVEHKEICSGDKWIPLSEFVEVQS